MTQSGRTVVLPSRSEQKGEHGQEDNWDPYEPGRAGIFSAHSAIEQREAGQGKGRRDQL
jgi:hypothetical protein